MVNHYFSVHTVRFKSENFIQETQDTKRRIVKKIFLITSQGF